MPLENTSNVNRENLTCYHCENPIVLSERIIFDNKDFCCQGCQSVYEILKGADLCDYYSLEERSAKRKTISPDKYNVLDEPSIIQNLLEFDQQGIARVTFFVPLIHCSSCIWLLEHLNKLNNAIHHTQVHFVKKEISITYRTDLISLSQVAILLDSIGYPPEIQTGKKKKGRNSTDLVLRLAVAGFCFGNSMLLSFMDYLSTENEIPDDFKAYFGGINLIFGLPVFFYSAAIYFKSAWKSLRHFQLNLDVPISLGIITLFSRSLYEILILGELGFIDSLAGLVFFLLIGRWFQFRTYQALSFDREISSYFPLAVLRLKEGTETITKIEDLMPKDIIRIRNREVIPAKSVLIDGQASIDYSFVTGESVPFSPAQREEIFPGGRQLGGPIVVEVTERVKPGHLARLWEQQDDQIETKDLKYLTDRLGQYFTIAVLLIASFSCFYWYIKDPTMMVPVVTSVLIVACPCALALCIPFAYGHGMRLLGKQGLYLKESTVIEKISLISSIVFDKTGTLTLPLPSDVIYHGKTLSTSQKALIGTVASNSLHPLSRILAQTLPNQKIEFQVYEELAGKGILAKAKDTTIQLGSSQWVKNENSNTTQTRVYLSINGEYFGFFAFKNQYRSQIFETLNKLKASFKLYLVSGDSDQEKITLDPYFDSVSFHQTALQKQELIQNLQKVKNEKVLMVGDGLNDAEALKTSFLGMALSEDVHQFAPGNDAILQADSIRLLPKFILFAKRISIIVYIGFAFSFLYNVIGLYFAINGQLTPLVSAILMPISSISVVGFISISVWWLYRVIFEKDK